MRTRAMLVTATIFMALGCVGQKQRTSSFKTVAIHDVAYDKTYDAAEAAIAKHFEILFSDRKSGVISTKYSSEKSIDGIIKLRAIAVLSKRADGAIDVNLKVIRERFWERWTGDHDLVTQKDFLGVDERFAGTILNEMRQLLVSSE